LSVWWIFYFKYGWKIKHLNKILYRINLNGTWFGDYESSDLNGEKIYKGKIGLRINQSFLNISVESFTEKYSNFSYSEEVKYEEKSNRHGLIYVYSQKDNHDFQLNQRNGTSELVVSNYKNDILLEGEFWTVHGTRGKLRVKRITSKIIDTFSEAKETYESIEGEQE